MDSEDIVRKFHQKRGRIRDPRSGIGKKFIPGSGSRIHGVKKHRIPDSDPGSGTLAQSFPAQTSSHEYWYRYRVLGCFLWVTSMEAIDGDPDPEILTGSRSYPAIELRLD
jgi:hypothetical protein